MNPMPKAILFATILILAGCSRNDHPAPAKAAAAPPVPATAAAREVVLKDAAQRQGAIRVENVQTRSLPQVLHANGRVALNENRTWRVGAVTEGRIVRVLVSPGDAVAPGQILARMHSHMIHEARADYRRALGELSRLKGVEAYSLRVRDRARRLYELKAASLEQVDHSETELRNAQTAVANANIEVERTRRHMVEFLQIRADVPDHAPEAEENDDSELIPIKSPAAGTLMIRNVTPGTVVQPSGELFVVSDLSTLWTIAALNEEYLPKVRAGMPVRVNVIAYPDHPFPARIGKIGEELDPTTRSVKVRVDVPNSHGLLKPEMYATTDIEIGSSELAVFVPQSAIQEISGQTVVFVRRDPTHFEVRPVQAGRIVEGAQEITGGLRHGEAVVTSGSFVLKSQLLKSTLGEE